MPSSYYEVLDVAADCTADDIRRAYHLAARRYHPDKRTAPAASHNGGRPHAGGEQNDSGLTHNSACHQFLQVQEAYETLRHAELREQYDATLARDELREKREQEVVVVSDEVAVDDMRREVLEGEDGESDEVLFTHQCRCGDLYEITEEELMGGVDIVPCTGCSLHIRVLRKDAS
ncbi:hypothetical protein BBJ28_00007053 [Nothophytophthora sp. Chile5]|nr:hypothetical protein BBJ28_00007053 [Nothophytophthora sp. Chile5]